MRILAALCMTALLGLLSSGSQAAGLPLVMSATVDYTHNTLTISGQNFGSNPSVTLDALAFPTQSSASSQIVANFPSGKAPSSFTPGTYFLTVTFRNQLPTIFGVDIGANGAVGPAGPAGVTGAQGLPGAQGAPGPAGPTGSQGGPGPMGPAGATGLAGQVGLTGSQGSQGLPGPQGSSGPQGPIGPAGVSSALNGIQDFGTTGAFTVPAGITKIQVELWGAPGGSGGLGGEGETVGGGSTCPPACTDTLLEGHQGANPGIGGYTKAIVPVIPGATYMIVVGSNGTNGEEGLSRLATNCNGACTEAGDAGANGTAGGDTELIDSTNNILVAAQGGPGGAGGAGGGGSAGPSHAPGGAGGVAAGGAQTTNIIGTSNPITGFPPSGGGQKRGYVLIEW
jgi:hypothetical protein